MAPSIDDGAPLGAAHPMLDLGEGLLDGIEVGRVRRQEPEPGTGGSDDLADGSRFVTAEVVHDDDIARLQGGHELLFDISTEVVAVDWSVEDARCSEPVAAQSAEEGQSAPMTVRSKATQALAFGSPAAQRCHIGLDPCLVDEDELLRIETILPGPPSLAPACNVAACLLKSEQRFF